LHASRSAASSDNGGVSLVIVPEGASVPKLQASLQALGLQSSILDGSQSADSANLLLVARSHVRGLDIPNISTVYLLNGLDVTSLSKSARAAGGVEERKREYTHFAGRMGRLGAKDQNEGEEKGERYALVGLVMRASAEEKAAQAMFGDKVALEVEVLKGEGILD
jgi:superfamily II DNA/RNA helicase